MGGACPVEAVQSAALLLEEAAAAESLGPARLAACAPDSLGGGLSGQLLGGSSVDVGAVWGRSVGPANADLGRMSKMEIAHGRPEPETRPRTAA